MTTLTITLAEDQLVKLQEIASRFQVTPEALATTSIEELLSRPSEAFEQAVLFVLNKNRELYQRLD